MSSPEPTIPPEYESITSAYVHFYNVPVLRLPNQDPVNKCLILVTSHGQLVEFINGRLSRIKEVPYKSVKKIIVHHEYEPTMIFIVILYDSNAAVLSYADFKLIQEWKNVESVSSNDEAGIGKPTLKIQLKNVTGTSTFVKLNEIIPSTLEAEEKGQKEAATALANSLKTSLQACQELQAECSAKETFIRQSLADFHLSHYGFNRLSFTRMADQTERCGNTSDISSQAPENVTFSAKGELPLKVSTRHRVFQGKWIICASLQNSSNSHLVQGLQMALSPSLGIKSLNYSTRLLKVSKRTSRGEESFAENSNPLVEEVDPPLLRPGKKAFLFAVCNLPDFESDKISCTGIISYKVRSVKPSKEEQTQKTHFAPMKNVSLTIASVQNNCLDLHTESHTPGFPFNVLALVAASKTQKYIICSLVTPLLEISEILKRGSFTKINNLENYYSFSSSSAHPLNHSLIVLKQVSLQKVSITSYTRDDSQAILLARTLLTLFPKDAHLQLESKAEEPASKKLLALMNDCLSFVCDADPTTGEDGTTAGVEDERPSKRGSAANAQSGDAGSSVLEDDEEPFEQWRKKLHAFDLEMDRYACKLKNQSQ